MNRVSIIIANWNQKELLKNCLDSIKKYTKNYKIIVIDNGSTDGSLEMLKKYKLDVIKNKINLGFPIANNQGIKYALVNHKPKYIYFLNNDTLVTENWLNNILKVAEENKEYGIYASKQRDFMGQSIATSGWINLFGVKYFRGDVLKEVNWANFAGVLVRSDVIKSVGLLNENYSPAYYEETDWEKRAINRGYKILYVPNSIIYHKLGQTTNKIKNEDAWFWMYRNRIRYFTTYYPKIYFLPRLIGDIFNAIKIGRLRMLFRAYKDGLEKAT